MIKKNAGLIMSYHIKSHFYSALLLKLTLRTMKNSI